MSSEFETILLPENVAPVVKTEPFTADDDDDPNENCSYPERPLAVEDSKIGEIFYVAKDHFKFVCAHCFAEFSQLTVFTVHVQHHLHEIFAESLSADIKGDTEMIEVKPLLFDCIADTTPQFDDDSAHSMAVNRTKKKLKCDDCDKQFDQPCLLRRHRALVHDGKMYRCTVCNIKIAWKYNMVRHLRTLHPENDSYYPLHICYANEPANTDDEAGDAVQANETDLVECCECDRTCASDALLKEHWNAEHFCRECNLRVKSVQKHMAAHHRLEEVNAPTTDAIATAIKLPSRQKNKFGLYECGDCDQSFRLFVQLRRHRDLTHDGKKFCCELCGIKARYKKNIRRHMKFKHPQQPQNAFIETYDALDIVRIHTGKKFNCKICGVAASYKKNIRRHMKSKHPNHPQNLFMETFDVERDNEREKSSSGSGKEEQPHDDRGEPHEMDEDSVEPLRNPIRIKEKYKCKKCNRNFRSQSVLKEHQAIHKTDLSAVSAEREGAAENSASTKPYECPICKLKYGYRKSFEKHLKIIHPKSQIDVKSQAEPDAAAHSSAEPLKNDPNALPSVSSSATIAISTTEGDVKPEPSQIWRPRAKKKVRIGQQPHPVSVCPICNLEFGNKWSLAWHNRNVHDPNGHTRESFECYACHMVLNTVTELKSHFRKKHYRIKYKPRPCTTCGKEFEDAFSFTKHRRWHKEQVIGRPHKCLVCEKTFVERFELGRHSLQHTTSRDFKCDICHRAYRTLSDKNWHMRTHTGENRKQCDECGKFLLDSEKLRRHMLTHTGESPFECEYCHKRFRQSYNLSIHKRIHTGEYIHYCKPCERGFGARRELRKHNLRIHGIETAEENVVK